MDLGLKGCAAIVAGSSSGMGHASALALAREGCNVTLFARRAELLEETVAADRRRWDRAPRPWR